MLQWGGHICTMVPSLPTSWMSCAPLPQASPKVFFHTSAALVLHSFRRTHSKVSIAHILISTNFHKQFQTFSHVGKNERVTSFKSSIACSQERRMGLLANAFNGVLLSCLLLGNFNDVASARAAWMAFSSEENKAEQQQVEPSKGDCATCLGVVDETLGACGAAPNCVSTFDDRPSFFIAPWEFPGKLRTAFQQIKLILMKEGGNIVEQGNRYLHVVFTEKDGTIDDLELLFSIPAEDSTVNIRSASRKFSQNDYCRNQKRLERIRQALMWEEVPVLRNRSRKLFFLESPWDTFGPEPPPAFDYEDKLEFVPD